MSFSKPDPRLALLAALLLLGACAGRSNYTSPAVSTVYAQPATQPAAQPAAQPATQYVRTATVPDPKPSSPPARSLRFDPRQAGLEVTVPRGWRVNRRDAALIYEGPMRLPSVAMFEPERRTLQDVVAGLPQELAPILGRVRITKAASPTTVGGYSAFVAEGTGAAEGFAMRWRATVIDAERLTIMLGLGPTFVWGMGEGRLRSFEQSIRRADAPVAPRR